MVNENSAWYVSYDNGTTWTYLGVNANGAVAGEKGDKGDTGVGIVSTAFDENGNTVIAYSDGTTQTIQHNWEKSFVLVEANCLTDGKELYSCTKCGLARIVTVPKTGHTDGKWITAVESTCTESGSKHQVCSVCGETIKTESIQENGHTYTKTTVAATCTSQGYDLHTCHCGDSYKDNYIATNGEHDFKESQTCKYCNQSIAYVATYICDNCYVVSRADGNYDVYVKGNMLDYDSSDSLFYDSYYADKIMNVYIADTITDIGAYAFRNCNLKSVSIPASVTRIGRGAFTNCDSLTAVYITDIEAWCNIKFDGNASNPLWHAHNLYLNGELVTKLKIPSTVKTINACSFNFCSIISIEIPDSVTSIENAAFVYCMKITSVYFKGTLNDWQNIEIAWNNEYFTIAPRYYYSETEPSLNAEGTAYDDNYWHYDTDGVTPIVWIKD